MVVRACVAEERRFYFYRRGEHEATAAACSSVSSAGGSGRWPGISAMTVKDPADLRPRWPGHKIYP